MLVVGCDLENSKEAVELAERFSYAGVYASVGVHPHEASHYSGGLPDALLRAADSPHVVAIGEAGLDYYYNHSPHDVQKEVFKMQVDWAYRIGKPLILHVRDAMDDVLSILRSYPEKVLNSLKMVFHCYSGGLDYLDEVLSLGAGCSIGGPVTWKKSEELRKTLAAIPEDRLLLETDCPWLTPAPFRGKLNEPSYVKYVYETAAYVRGLQLEALARIVDANAAELFGWRKIYV